MLLMWAFGRSVRRPFTLLTRLSTPTASSNPGTNEMVPGVKVSLRSISRLAHDTYADQKPPEYRRFWPPHTTGITVSALQIRLCLNDFSTS